MGNIQHIKSIQYFEVKDADMIVAKFVYENNFTSGQTVLKYEDMNAVSQRMSLKINGKVLNDYETTATFNSKDFMIIKGVSKIESLEYKESMHDQIWHVLKATDICLGRISAGDFSKPINDAYQLDPKVSNMTDHSVKLKFADIVTWNDFQTLMNTDILLYNKPCTIKPAQLMKVIRSFLRDNMDLRYAIFDRDDSSSIAIKKVVKIKTEEIWAEEKKNGGDPYVVPRFSTSFRTQRDTPCVFKIKSPSITTYLKDYHTVEPLEGSNVKDLKDRLDVYLKSILKVVNEPLKDCECCGGRGVQNYESFSHTLNGYA